MAQNGAVFVFCSSCKILYFASSVHPRIATVLLFGDGGIVDRVAEKILNIILSLFWHAVFNLSDLFCATAAIIKVVSKSLICGQRN